MITLGITECNKWKNYRDWFFCESAEIINLSHRKNNIDELKRCNGVVLSGGEDVHPKFYGKPEYLSILDPKEINQSRDEFELKVIAEILKNKIPLLGICRGLQIANVYFGGTLIPDLQGESKAIHSKHGGNDRQHTIQIEHETLLNNITDSEKGTVNSAHHQAVAQTGKELKVTAKAEDGITEAMEWKNPENKSFLLLVQWHPERMQKQQSPFAKNIRDAFLSFCRKK